jgi:hypothetical protein
MVKGGTPALPAGRGSAGGLGQVAGERSALEVLQAELAEVLVGHQGPSLVDRHGPEHQALQKVMVVLVSAGGHPALECGALRSRPPCGGGGRRGGLPLLDLVLRLGCAVGSSLLLLASRCAGRNYCSVLVAAKLRTLAALAVLPRRHLITRAATRFLERWLILALRVRRGWLASSLLLTATAGDGLQSLFGGCSTSHDGPAVLPALQYKFLQG